MRVAGVVVVLVVVAVVVVVVVADDAGFVVERCYKWDPASWQ